MEDSLSAWLMLFDVAIFGQECTRCGSEIKIEWIMAP